ncbi:YxlC family protein [Paenibacillus faecalis]|uniref:YxlC family protein n=1 Tax=Paenibacillus faecalis TaxID=2079532 RepID=UPI000D0ED197|nr:YxlC family protein [Paenibacillus faecalis]
MSERSNEQNEQLIASLKAELSQIDSAFEKPAPPLDDFHKLAVHTLANQKRRWRNELFIFLLVAVFIVSAVFLAAWLQPVMLWIVHGGSMLVGAVILTLSLRSPESRDSHD